MTTDPTAAMPVPEALDALTLSRLGQLDPTGQARLVQRVLAAYLQSLARLRQQITESMAHGDQTAVRLSAHTLKSSSASIGALQLSSLCSSVEQAIREDQQEHLADLLARLQDEAERVDEAVRLLIAN